MVESFLELVDILEITPPSKYDNSIDLTVDGDQSFLLGSGIVSHNSASSAFRQYRDPNFQGAFPLRGKFLNVTELPATRVIQNAEVKDLMTAIGLRMGEEPKDLRYGKILIYADADPDGDSIAGLLINFFGRYWPELFEQGRIARVLTPLVVVSKGSEKHLFYTNEDFEKWEKSISDLKRWEVAYKKGLAALEDSEYREIIVNPKMFTISPGSRSKFTETLNCWFAGDPQHRKRKILALPSEDSDAEVVTADSEVPVE